MANDYLTVENYLKWSRAQSDDGTDDTDVITPLITHMSRFIDNLTMREEGYFNTSGVDNSTRYFIGSGGAEMWIDPCTSISTVQTSDDIQLTWDSWTLNTDYWRSSGARGGRDQSPFQLLIVNPNGSYNYWPTANRSIDTVKISAVWGGYTSTPDAIAKACFKLTHQEYHLKEAGIAEDRPLATDSGVWLPAGGIPKSVRLLLASYQKRSI